MRPCPRNRLGCLQCCAGQHCAVELYCINGRAGRLRAIVPLSISVIGSPKGSHIVNWVITSLANKLVSCTRA
jgi:hypothetical protein